MIIERVRNSGDAMQVPLRCGAPHARRWFEMTVSPEADGHVHFHSVLVFEELREPVAFLDAFVERNSTDDEIALCTWCAQAEYGEWCEVEDVVRRARLLERSVMPPVVHGVCSACRDGSAVNARSWVPTRSTTESAGGELLAQLAHPEPESRRPGNLGDGSKDARR